MTGIELIGGLLMVVVPFAIFLIKRLFAKKDDPATQRKQAKAEADEAIAAGDADKLTRIFESRLRQSESENPANPNRAPNNPVGSSETVHTGLKRVVPE